MAQDLLDSSFDAASAINFAKNLDYHVAVKADGLAAGKGVIICDKKEQVLESIDEMLGGKFGSAGHRIVGRAVHNWSRSVVYRNV